MVDFWEVVALFEGSWSILLEDSACMEHFGRFGRGGVRLRRIVLHSRRRGLDVERRVINALAATEELDVARVFR